MRRSIRRALIAGAVAVTALAAVPAVQALGAGSVTATFTASSDWGGGHEGKVTVVNGTSAAVNWQVEFTLPAGTTITSSWDADVTRSGEKYIAKGKSWAGALAPGASYSWGYIGSGGFKSPSSCTVNGASCAGGAGPTDGPTSQPPTSQPPTSQPPTSQPPTSQPPTQDPTTGPSGDKKLIAYYIQWGVFNRQHFVKNLVDNGTAAKLTHITYAFGQTSGGRCSLGDPWPDTDMAFTADKSVDGVADTWDQPLRGNFNQLRKLKKMYPKLKVLYSFGGWTWSGGFSQAAQNPQAFADSCYALLNDPKWAGLFDGIDIDWEYPNACGLSCDTSGFGSYKTLMQTLRAKFGPNYLVTSAITADGSNGGKIDAADYGGAAQYLDWYMVMTYDYFGAFAPQGPTAPHSPLTAYPGIPAQGFNSDAAIQKLKSKNIPANKLLLGIGFYGRGWTGVNQDAPGGTASGPAPGTYEPGIEDYKVLKNTCPVTGTVGGTAYAKCGNNWYGYDTPGTIAGKMTYAKNQNLGGAFFWETSGDTANGELVSAMHNGLR